MVPLRGGFGAVGYKMNVYEPVMNKDRNIRPHFYKSEWREALSIIIHYSFFIFHYSLKVRRSIIKPAVFFFIFLIAFGSSPSAFANAIDPEEMRLSIIDTLNSLRGKYGCGELKTDPHLAAAAQYQAEYLAKIEKLDNAGPSGESAYDRAMDAGYGGDKSFTVKETNAKVWVDTDVDYLIEEVWRKSQASVRAIFDPAVRQIGIGIADAPDKHRYYVLMLAGLDDGTDDYSMTRPTYDYRTPKPTISATPTMQPLLTSTPNPDGGIYHIVQKGETFSEIALAYGLDWYSLSVLNHIKLSDTTPVVIIEGQTLVIAPTYTLTPTPTPTKTPLPPTRTLRPTYTTDPNIKPSQQNTGGRLPNPNLNGLLEKALPWKRTVGWILVGICVPGVILSLRRRK